VIHLAAVLLGDGVRLYDSVGTDPIVLTRTALAATGRLIDPSFPHLISWAGCLARPGCTPARGDSAPPESSTGRPRRCANWRTEPADMARPVVSVWIDSKGITLSV
jgi:hypothetical protein